MYIQYKSCLIDLADGHTDQYAAPNVATQKLHRLKCSSKHNGYTDKYAAPTATFGVNQMKQPRGFNLGIKRLILFPFVPNRRNRNSPGCTHFIVTAKDFLEEFN